MTTDNDTNPAPTSTIHVAPFAGRNHLVFRVAADGTTTKIHGPTTKGRAWKWARAEAARTGEAVSS